MPLPSLRRQRGNTLTGIIIGLIIGLAIAVVVALVITKGASPFTDKGSKAKVEQSTGQASDPNKPMYTNKEAARAANREIAERQAAAEARRAEAEAAAARSEGDPLGDAIAALKPDAKPAAAPAPAPVPAPAAPGAAPPAGPQDDGVIYYLQAGAFREIADAENVRAKLALLGFEANISDRSTDAGVLHRVRVGPYANEEAMKKARAKLQGGGIDVAIVRNQK